MPGRLDIDSYYYHKKWKMLQEKFKEERCYLEHPRVPLRHSMYITFSSDYKSYITGVNHQELPNWLDIPK